MWRGLVRIPDGRTITFSLAFGLLGADVRALGAGKEERVGFVSRLWENAARYYFYHPGKGGITAVEPCDMNLRRSEPRVSEPLPWQRV